MDDLKSGLVGAVSAADKDEMKHELRLLAAEMKAAQPAPRRSVGSALDEAAEAQGKAMESMRAELEALRNEVSRPRGEQRDQRRTTYATMKRDLSMLKRKGGTEEDAARIANDLRRDMEQYAAVLQAGVVGGSKQDREEMRDELRSLFQDFAATHGGQRQDAAAGHAEAKDDADDKTAAAMHALTARLEGLSAQVAAQQPAEARQARSTSFKMMKRDLASLRAKDRLAADAGAATAEELEQVKRNLAAYSADLRAGLLIETNDAEKERMREEVRAFF